MLQIISPFKGASICKWHGETAWFVWYSFYRTKTDSKNTNGNLKEAYAAHTIREPTGKWNCLEIDIITQLMPSYMTSETYYCNKKSSYIWTLKNNCARTEKHKNLSDCWFTLNEPVLSFFFFIKRFFQR